MMITLLCILVCFAVLYFRYRAQRNNNQRRTTKQKIKTAKILFAALLAWLAIGYALQHLNESIDGAVHPPSLMERVVAYLAK